MSTTETSAPGTAESIGDAFRSALLMSLEECFATVQGFMLDKGGSFFETLADVSAEEASAPVSSQGASLAAQVNHTRFYIDALIDVAKTGEYKKLDWDSSWRVGAVDDAGWQDLVARLRASYESFRTM
ncbi:MAG: hypothetical protein AB7V46_12015, partial [Thermomicrobiales bacterium]